MKRMVFAAAIAAFGGTVPQASAQTTDITLGTSSSGGSWYPAAQVMARVIEEEIDDVRVTVMPGGSLSNVKGVSGGQYDIAFAHSQDIATAMAGEGDFEAPVENVRGMISLWTNYLQVGVRPDEGIESIGDLAGHSIAPGNRGWGGEAATQMILGYNDMSYDDMEKVEFTGWRGMIDLYKDRHVDAVFAVSTAGLSAFQEMTVGGTELDLLPLPQETISQAIEDNAGYFEATLPAATYDGQEEDIRTLGSKTLLFTRADMPEDLIRNITSVLLNHREDLVSALAALEEMTPKFAAQVPESIPLHEGAKAYYEEQGLLNSN